jgi:hypothetical protein
MRSYNKCSDNMQLRVGPGNTAVGPHLSTAAAARSLHWQSLHRVMQSSCSLNSNSTKTYQAKHHQHQLGCLYVPANELGGLLLQHSACQQTCCCCPALPLLPLQQVCIASHYLPDVPHRHSGYKTMAVTSLSILLRVHTHAGFCWGACIANFVLYLCCYVCNNIVEIPCLASYSLLGCEAGDSLQCRNFGMLPFRHR